MNVFLDLDGTLINSFDRHYVLLKEICTQMNIPFNMSKESYFALKREGLNNKKILSTYCQFPSEIVNEIQMEWVKHIEDNDYLELDYLYNDAIPFLNYLTKKGYKIYLLTARKNNSGVKHTLKKNEILDYFAKIYVVNPEKASENKANILEKYKESDTILIGDTEVEALCAKKLGISAFILNRGFRSANYLKENFSLETYGSLIQLEEVV